MTMKTSRTNRLLIAWLLAVAASVPGLRAAEEQDLVATLQSTAGAPQKWAACQRLRLIGTADAVPALAALLTDQRLSQAARHTLEALPCPEAGGALRQALGQTSGLLKAGIADSLGWRGEPASVPLLAPLVSDSDTTVAAAAAAALGRIGGRDALEALTAARDAAPLAVQSAVYESLLKCAERLAARDDNAGAAAIYRGLFDPKYPVQVRVAAWRGLVLADSEHRAELMGKALAGTDRPIQAVALKVVRELKDRQAILACVGQWASLPVESQLAVLDAEVKLGAEALPAVQTAGQSPDVAVRAAAWQALGELNDTTSIPALAKAAAQGQPAEREAARESLARLHGTGAREALLAQIEPAPAPEKAELLRALGERDDRAAANVLLQYAASDAPSVRLAALESLRRLAPPEAMAPLLEIAAKSKSDDQRDPALQALYAICQASPNKEEAARSTLQALGRFPAAERRQLLPLLAELGTADALAAAQAASNDPDPELAKEAVRVLAQWPNAAPAPHLLGLARAGGEPTLRTLALRGAIACAAQEPDAAKRLTLLEQALSAASRTEEKKQALGQLGQVPMPEALALVLKNLQDPALSAEASLAAVIISEKLAPSNPALADDAALKVLELVHEGDLFRRAWALRHKPGAGGAFIRDWLVCGPYRQAGVVGAVAVFEIPFGPEKPGQNVQWKAAPSADHVALSALFPGEENCAAYLRTRIIAPQDCSGVLLMGSDDGIKAWLNGKVVHSNNVDRGELVDQDAAPIQLKKGANELMLKISQGGGGWSASARIVGADGKPVQGLRVERPAGAD